MSFNSHLTYPSASTPGASTSRIEKAPDAIAPPRVVTASERLYVGNLHPSVDEYDTDLPGYSLLQVFSKCGKIAGLDFLFHKTGPSKGKPRGYAFVEYCSLEDAKKAVATFHDRTVRGRKLVVTFASQTQALDAPYSSTSSSSLSLSGSAVRRKHHHAPDPTRTTALSLIKTHTKPVNTQAKIAALEAKLQSMQKPPEGPDAGGRGKGIASLPPKPRV